MSHVNKDDVQQGHILHVQGSDEFVKVDKLRGDQVIGRTVTPDYDEDPERQRKVSLKSCDKCMSPHEFGQHKRFTPGGRGFSKQGRHLKNNHSRIFDDKDIDVEARKFILEEISSEDFLNSFSESHSSNGDSYTLSSNDFPDRNLKVSEVSPDGNIVFTDLTTQERVVLRKSGSLSEGDSVTLELNDLPERQLKVSSAGGSRVVLLDVNTQERIVFSRN